MSQPTITIKEYLTQKSIPFRESGGELITKCLFHNCDEDSRTDEAHLYFSVETGQYDCKKCGEKGNIVTLAKHLGDSIQDIALKPRVSTKKPGRTAFGSALVESCYLALPARIRQYLNARGITDAVVDEYKLGYGSFYSSWWITIPIKDSVGNYIYFKLRQDPTLGDRKMTSQSKIKAQLYDWQAVESADGTLVICEGELDRLLLVSRGVNAVTGTHGAPTFSGEWIDYILQNKKIKKIYVCFDYDKAGREGAERLAGLLNSEGNVDVYIVALPPEVGEHGDVTNYFMNFGGTVEDLMNKYAMSVTDFEKILRVVKLDKPKRETTIEDWQQIVRGYFPELLFPSEVGLSIISQILIKDITNPFALVLVDVPSAGKTISINFFSEIKELTYASDKFTPASFVSNASNVQKEKLSEIDLLPRLRYKMFLLRDLSTIFSKRDDDLNECLGLLTRVLDGEGLNTDSGIHGQRQYVGEYLFMILAGSTPIPPRVWKMMGNLGSRLFFLNMGVKEKSEEELAEQLTSLAYKEKEKVCRKITKGFLQTLWNKYPEGVEWNKPADAHEIKILITRCAKLLANLRGVINIWKEKYQDGDTYDYTQPVIEKPDRINQLFYNLCRGHALVCGRTQIHQDDLRLIVELAIDSAPNIRAKLFRKILDQNGTIKTSGVMDALSCSRPTALKEMEALKILKVGYISDESYGEVGQPEKVFRLNKNFEWFLSDECRNIRGLPLKIEPKVAQQDTLADLFNDNQ
ncbi:MAG: toprim domain-containing protein [bacterium]